MFDPDFDYYGHGGNIEDDDDLVFVQSPYWDSRYLGIGPVLPPEY